VKPQRRHHLWSSAGYCRCCSDRCAEAGVIMQTVAHCCYCCCSRFLRLTSCLIPRRRRVSWRSSGGSRSTSTSPRKTSWPGSVSRSSSRSTWRSSTQSSRTSWTPTRTKVLACVGGWASCRMPTGWTWGYNFEPFGWLAYPGPGFNLVVIGSHSLLLLLLLLLLLWSISMKT